MGSERQDVETGIAVLFSSFASGSVRPNLRFVSQIENFNDRPVAQALISNGQLTFIMNMD